MLWLITSVADLQTRRQDLLAAAFHQHRDPAELDIDDAVHWTLMCEYYALMFFIMLQNILKVKMPA